MQFLGHDRYIYIYMPSSDHDTEEAGDCVATFDLALGNQVRAIPQRQSPLGVGYQVDHAHTCALGEAHLYTDWSCLVQPLSVFVSQPVLHHKGEDSPDRADRLLGHAACTLV